MHYTLKKAIFPLVFLFVSGCSTQPKVAVNEKFYETDTASAELSILEFKNFSDKEFEESLNKSYRETVDEWIEEFFLKCEKEASPEKGIFRLTQNITHNKSPVLSAVGEVYAFSGGIHGCSSRICKNIDTVKNVELSLADLFTDDCYEDMLNREIEKIIEANTEEYRDLWEKPIISSMHQKFFYLTDKGLVIFYPPYELSYYARGFVEFTIPYSAMRGYIKPEYS